MKVLNFSLVLLLSISMTIFAAAQSNTYDHSKMHKSTDTSFVKDTTQVTVKGRYTCPMHHDYFSDKLGKCPKCGMTLVKVMPAANVKKSHKMHKDTLMVVPTEKH